MDATLRKIAKEHLKYLRHLLRTENDEKTILTDAYLYTKGIIPDFYDGKYMDDVYNDYVKVNVAILESKFKLRIIDAKTNFMPENKSIRNFDYMLDYIVFRTREHILNGQNVDFDSLNLLNRCHDASNYVQDKCDAYNIKSKILKIIPGYDINACIYGPDFMGYHFANIIEYDDSYYLMDLTYSQFFYIRNNVLDRIGLVNIPPCDPGIFMLMSDEGKEIANELISKGYIKLDKNKLKTYLDAFTVSFRNGLYYESTDDFSFKTEYTLADYHKLLNGKMSQVEIEGIDNLGIQTRPLKDAKMMIKRK